jgi:hypothetical protein
LRTILLAFFTAALIVVSGQSKAAPRNIDECEKIQAADAYNLCLASFGPVARGHQAFADGVGGGKQEETVSSGSRHVEAAQRGDRGMAIVMRSGADRRGIAGQGTAPDTGPELSSALSMGITQQWHSASFKAARDRVSSDLQLHWSARAAMALRSPPMARR